MDRNWLDAFIGFFSPATEAKRIRARILSHQIQRHYEGATKGRRGASFKGSTASADAASGPALPTLRLRSRDLVRNNAFAERAIRVIQSNVIGTGIIPTAKTEDKARKDALEKLWISWGDTRACDYDGLHDFYGLQALILRAVAQDGEVLVRKRYQRTADRLGIPLQLQVLESDYLDTTKDGMSNGANRIVQGVEIDARDRVVAYWLYEEHPGTAALSSLRANYKSNRVPASEITRIYRRDRPGQLRGVPWGAPVMLKMQDLSDYEDAQLIKQKISACFVGFQKDIENPDVSGMTETEKEDFGRFEPGTWELLPPGKEMQFASPPPVTGYAEYIRSMVRSIAIGYGVTYESISGDYSQVNFSSARMGWLEFQRNIEFWRNQMMIPMFCQPAWEWFIEAANLSGQFSGVASALWTSPRREMIDPVKETSALKDQVRCGFKSQSEAIREYGKDPIDVFNEMESDNKILDEKKLTIDTDPRQKAMLSKPTAEPNEDKEEGGK